MNITNTPIADLKIVQLSIYRDSRGFFVEKFNKKIFEDIGLPTNYFQDNFSYSSGL